MSNEIILKMLKKENKTIKKKKKTRQEESKIANKNAEKERV